MCYKIKIYKDNEPAPNTDISVSISGSYDNLLNNIFKCNGFENSDLQNLSLFNSKDILRNSISLLVNNEYSPKAARLITILNGMIDLCNTYPDSSWVIKKE